MGFERRQVMIGVGILGVFLLIVLALMLGWRKVPGVVGETLGIFAGIISTPFLLEFSFVVAGLMIVVGLNSWRRHREGDELVYLEEVEGLPETRKQKPEASDQKVEARDQKPEVGDEG